MWQQLTEYGKRCDYISARRAWIQERSGTLRSAELNKDYQYNYSQPDEMIPTFTVDDSDNVYIGTKYGTANTSFTGITPLIKFNNGNVDTGNGYAVAKYNIAGQLLWHKEHPKMFARSFDVLPSGNILLYGEFTDFWGFNSPLSVGCK